MLLQSLDKYMDLLDLHKCARTFSHLLLPVHVLSLPSYTTMSLPPTQYDSHPMTQYYPNDTLSSTLMSGRYGQKWIHPLYHYFEEKTFAKQMIIRKVEGSFLFIEGFTVIYLLLLYDYAKTFQIITNLFLKCLGCTLSCFIKYIIKDHAPLQLLIPL